jgi:photosystem II stability/assembly factor-like uncharacterized protein
MRAFKISLLIFILSITISAQWEWTNPKPLGNNLKRIYFIDSTTGWIAGNRGAILRHTNESNWQFTYSDSIRDDISSIKFLNKNLGFATSSAIGSTQQGRIYKSTNGGESWQQLFAFSRKLYDIIFINDSIGWAVGNGIISKTTDCGLSWNDQILDNSLNFNTCYFSDSLNGWAVGNVIYHTDDGGTSWSQQIFTVSATYNSISFADSLHGWLAGALTTFPYYGSLLRSTDGGNTWFEFTISTGSLTCISFLNDSLGWLSNSTGTIFNTTNGGNDWVSVSNISSGISNFFFVDSDRGWLINPGGIIRSTIDGGVNWVEHSGGFRNNVISSCFIDSLKGWALLQYSKIIHTTDGGLNWTLSYTPPFAQELTEITFIDESYGFAVGRQIVSPYGTIVVKTTNGGEQWSTIFTQINIGDPLGNVKFINRQIGFTGYYNIYKTTNGGFTWTSPQTIQTPIRDIFFLDSLNGWISSSDGLIYRTADCGNSWNLIGSGQDTVIHCLYFVNENIGWAGGWGGLLMNTTDGGYTWQYHLVGNWAIESIFFSDMNTGWAVGDNRRKTTNGGQTWESLWIPTDYKIKKVQFINENLGWFTGDNGVILKYRLDEPSAIDNEKFNNTPLNYKLANNYPNPFNPVTKIKYEIPASLNPSKGGTLVQLKVYDILGREVATLVKEEKPAGEYEAEFDGSVLTSGIYFYQLNAGDYRETKKMILLK